MAITKPYVARGLHSGTLVLVDDDAVLFPGPGAVSCPTCGSDRWSILNRADPKPPMVVCGCGLAFQLSMLTEGQP